MDWWFTREEIIDLDSLNERAGVCERRRREHSQAVQKMRAAAARDAALARGMRVGPHREQDEAGRVNRILELMDQHWRAATPWERAELDAEIRRLSRMG